MLFGKRYFITLLLTCFIASCNEWEGGFSTPQDLNDGWKVSETEEAGFDSEALGRLISAIPAGNQKLNAVVIARHGKLVVDQYYNGYDARKLCKIWSVTKVITSSILGIAVDKGLLKVEDSIYRYMDDYLPLISESAKAITIEHLLTMTSGYKWTEMGGPRSAGFRLAYSPDWIAFTLKQPHVATPGSTFNYSSGNSLLLAPILHHATGRQAAEFAREHFFRPLGITKYQWDLQSEFWTRTEGGELPGAKRPGSIN